MEKMTIKATDYLLCKSVEVPIRINVYGDVNAQFNDFCRQKKGRQAIIKGLNLTFGEAKLELLYEGKAVCEGVITNNVFSGQTSVKTWRKAA